MKLIVGLGNPGKEYKDTRHNIGFIVLDNYLGNIHWQKKMEANFYATTINDEQVIFLKPITYMNSSGISVSKVVNYYKIKPQDILVIQDDLDMNIGTFKLKRNSNHGGHHGIESIIKLLKTNEFARLKIGISKSATIPVDKYVLGCFTSKEKEIIFSNTEQYNKIIDLFITGGIEKAMAFNNN